MQLQSRRPTVVPRIRCGGTIAIGRPIAWGKDRVRLAPCPGDAQRPWARSPLPVPAGPQPTGATSTGPAPLAAHLVSSQGLPPFRAWAGRAALRDSLGAGAGQDAIWPRRFETTYWLVNGASDARRTRRCNQLMPSRHGMKTA